MDPYSHGMSHRSVSVIATDPPNLQKSVVSVSRTGKYNLAVKWFNGMY